MFTIDDLDKAEKAITQHPKYGPEGCLVKTIFNRHPLNDDLYWIAAKVSVIDVTNSTQLSKYKRNLSLFDISKILLDLNIDKAIKEGNIEIVNEIARKCKKDNGVNLFSFASKYCCYHNVYVYGRDDFSIFDNVVSQHLHEYATDKNPLKKAQPNNWRKDIKYEAYNKYIGNLLDEMGIDVPFRRRMFDHFVWCNEKNKSHEGQ